MEKIDGIWYMKGKAINDSSRIKSWQEVVELVNKIGFLPFFANEVEGFSLEEMVAADFWWTGIASEDPWEWREIIARSKEVAYGKFFDKRAGFISKEWLPIFANARRAGYDFDSRYADGKASRDNAERNGVSDRLELYLPKDQPEEMKADVVVANILAGPLRELAPLISVLPVSGGLLGLSGILASQAESVCEAYADSFALDPVVEKEEWCRITGRKN